MKRTPATILLTLAATPGLAVSSPRWPPFRQPAALDVEVTDLVAVRRGVPAPLCVGPDNAVRVSLVWHGGPPSRATLTPTSLRLTLALPGGPPGGTLVAEGSAAGATFTFLHVEIGARLRGRGARLVARANADGAMAERDLANDVRTLAIDEATDWSCRSR